MMVKITLSIWLVSVGGGGRIVIMMLMILFVSVVDGADMEIDVSTSLTAVPKPAKAELKNNRRIDAHAAILIMPFT